MEEIIRVGQNRLAVIVGTDGKVKRKIQKKTNTKIEVDSSLGEVIITSNQTFFEIHLAKKIVTAIARGFSPENAFYLLKDNYSLEVIYLDDFIKNSKHRHRQIKGRVIGREGRIKQIIEKRYNCILSIYGKTVSIIGDEDRIKNAREAVEKILSGAKHSTVLKTIKRDSILDGFSVEKPIEKIDDIKF